MSPMYPQQSQADREREEREAQEAAAARNAERLGKIEAWKLKQYHDQGFSAVASELLLQWKVDHHETRKMLAAGCSHTLAMEILRPVALPPSREAR